MRRLISLLCLVLALVSCQKPLFDTLPRWKQPLRRGGPFGLVSQPDSLAPDQVPRHGLYLSGLRFPEGVDWRAGDFSGARAVLWQDSVERVSVPAAPEPDRLRIWDGDLWTDRVLDGETVVYCNGTERLRYPGEEVLRGFLLAGGEVHTLGQRPGNGGVCYRVDGTEVFASAQGVVLGATGDPAWEGGALMRDSTGVYFVYGIPVRRGEEDWTWEYRVMRGAEEVRLVSALPGTGRVWDIRVRDGTVWRCEQRGADGESLSLVKEDLSLSLGLNRDDRVHLCKLLPVGDRMMVRGYSQDGSWIMHWVRGNGGRPFTENRRDVQELYVDGNTRALVTTNTDGSVAWLFQDQYQTLVEPGFRLDGRGCGAYAGGRFAVALTAVSGNRHLVVVNGAAYALEFNGFFTSLKFY